MVFSSFIFGEFHLSFGESSFLVKAIWSVRGAFMSIVGLFYIEVAKIFILEITI